MSPRRLSLLSFNIQAGATTRRYREYVTRGWTHVLPAKAKRGNLDSIARAAAEFDIVGLQEADPGSLRSSFLNQTHYLAEQAGFPFWSQQANRRVGGIASSANGVLSRVEPLEVLDHVLPSRIPGRGALVVRYGPETGNLVVVITHLSLSIKARIGQLAHISELVDGSENIVVMGDLNCEAGAREIVEIGAEFGGMSQVPGSTPRICVCSHMCAFPVRQWKQTPHVTWLSAET